MNKRDFPHPTRIRRKAPLDPHILRKQSPKYFIPLQHNPTCVKWSVNVRRSKDPIDRCETATPEIIRSSNNRMTTFDVGRHRVRWMNEKNLRRRHFGKRTRLGVRNFEIRILPPNSAPNGGRVRVPYTQRNSRNWVIVFGPLYNLRFGPGPDFCVTFLNVSWPCPRWVFVNGRVNRICINFFYKTVRFSQHSPVAEKNIWSRCFRREIINRL